MRRYIKRQLLALADMMAVAQDTIKRDTEKRQFLSVFRLLEDCQASAVRIGEVLEQEDIGVQMIPVLEEYCDLAFEYGQSLEAGRGLAKLLKAMQKRLFRIRDYIQNQIQAETLEVVFLPYKYSMWDSLESIWRAAKMDSSCDAYVIPIPYYDKNQDGSFSAMHDESSLYPDEIPITDWHAYSIEERHPDIIIIHNPYDDRNRVTSVHPDYYSERLKNYTDLLVYVPYFISPDDVPSHFCVCPGTIFADRVFVQSEKVRNTYIQEFRRFLKENRCEGKFGKPEEKFQATGSPKSDKVCSATRMDYTFPESWRSSAVHKDGSFKKVIFYNTTIEALLSQREQLLDKIERVLEQFKNNSDKVVLLWRPHPLLESTLHSMLPYLLPRYGQIVSRFKEEGWGIFDDSGDLYRAIALSDAYYGDWSSVVELYRATGKPVMIQEPGLV